MLAGALLESQSSETLQESDLAGKVTPNHQACVFSRLAKAVFPAHGKLLFFERS
jgi:hypothetical protein